MEVLVDLVESASRDFRFLSRSARAGKKLSRTSKERKRCIFVMLHSVTSESDTYILYENTYTCKIHIKLLFIIFSLFFKLYEYILKLFSKYILIYPFYILSPNYEATWIILTHEDADLYIADTFLAYRKARDLCSQTRNRGDIMWRVSLSNNQRHFSQVGLSEWPVIFEDLPQISTETG